MRARVRVCVRASGSARVRACARSCARAREVERLHNDLMLSAAQMNDASALSQHLKKGARANYTTGSGFTPLSYAALHNNPSMARYLLASGADCFKVDSTGNKKNKKKQTNKK